MNDFLLQIFKLNDEIKHDGWIVFPPASNPNHLIIRVEWFLKKRHGFERVFTENELKLCRVNLFERFIEDANLEIEKIIVDDL